MHRVALVTLAMALAGSPVAEAKPTAPVIVYMYSRPVAAGYEVTLVAVPRQDVPALELDLGSKHVDVGPSLRGQARSVTETFAVPPEGTDIVGSATVRDGHRFRNAPAMIRLGPAAPVEKRTSTVITLPDGTRIREAR